MANTLKAAARAADEVINDIIAYFEDNEDIFNQCMEELDSYNGYLNDSRYYEMDELDEFYSNTEPSEILYRAFYGYDENACTIDKDGYKEHFDPFNPNRDYFKFNAYGNLVSTDFKDYSNFLDRCTVESMSIARDELYTINEDSALRDLFDELGEALKKESRMENLK